MERLTLWPLGQTYGWRLSRLWRENVFRSMGQGDHGLLFGQVRFGKSDVENTVTCECRCGVGKQGVFRR